MQTQPFMIDHLNEYRRADLYAASVDVHCERRPGRPGPVGRLIARISAWASQLQPVAWHRSAAGSGATAVTGR